jgi:hypothetical protein
MSRNPIWRESVAIYFAEGHGFQVYFYLLIILAPVEFFSLYIPSLDAQMWSGSASLFKVCAVTAQFLLIYFALRVANQEFAPWRFKALRLWIRDEGQSVDAIGRGQRDFLITHVMISVLLLLPLLSWAGAIARTPLASIAGTMLLLLFYALSYCVWGLAALALWERRLENRQVFVRCLFAALVIITALFYGTINPVMYLVAFLSRHELPSLAIFGWLMPASWVHFGFHLLLGGAGYRLHRWALRRELAG